MARRAIVKLPGRTATFQSRSPLWENAPLVSSVRNTGRPSPAPPSPPAVVDPPELLEARGQTTSVRGFMTVLVTGAAGFIGFHVADRLLARGETVVGIDNVNDYYSVRLKRDRIAELQRRHGAEFGFREVDFADERALGGAVEGLEFDRIVHLGAQAGVRYSLENPHAYVRANLLGHLNLLELARHRATAHMAYASSSRVYGGNDTLPFRGEDRVDHPLSFYAATKKADELMSETYAHLYRLPLTGLRFFTVYGPWGRPDMAMWLFTKKILAGKPIPVCNHGQRWRDFPYIDDIIAGVIACLDNPPADDGAAKAGGSVKPHA